MSAPLSDHGVSAPRPDRLRSSLTRPKHAELLTWHILRAARDADVPIKIFANEDPEEVVIAFCAEHMATTTTPGSGVIQHGSVPFPHLRTARPRAPAARPSPPVAPLTRRAVLPYLLSSPSPFSSSRPRFAPPGVARVAASRVARRASPRRPPHARPPRELSASRPDRRRARAFPAYRESRGGIVRGVAARVGERPDRHPSVASRAPRARVRSAAVRARSLLARSAAARAREARESSDAAQTSAPPPLPPAAARRPMPPVAAAPGSVGDDGVLSSRWARSPDASES